MNAFWTVEISPFSDVLCSASSKFLNRPQRTAQEDDDPIRNMYFVEILFLCETFLLSVMK